MWHGMDQQPLKALNVQKYSATLFSKLFLSFWDLKRWCSNFYTKVVFNAPGLLYSKNNEINKSVIDQLTQTNSPWLEIRLKNHDLSSDCYKGPQNNWNLEPQIPILFFGFIFKFSYEILTNFISLWLILNYGLQHETFPQILKYHEMFCLKMINIFYTSWRHFLY